MQQANLSTATSSTINDDASAARLMAAMTAFMAADFVDDIAFAVAQEDAQARTLVAAQQNANQNEAARRAA